MGKPRDRLGTLRKCWPGTQAGQKGIARTIHDHQTEHVATKVDWLVLKAELAEFRAAMRFHRWALVLIVALVLAVLGKVW